MALDAPVVARPVTGIPEEGVTGEFPRDATSWNLEISGGDKRLTRSKYGVCTVEGRANSDDKDLRFACKELKRLVVGDWDGNGYTEVRAQLQNGLFVEIGMSSAPPEQCKTTDCYTDTYWSKRTLTLDELKNPDLPKGDVTHSGRYWATYPPKQYMQRAAAAELVPQLVEIDQRFPLW